MLGNLLENFGHQLSDAVLGTAERRWERLQASVKRTGVAFLFLQIAKPFFVIGCGLFLTALFLGLAGISYLIMPAVWTGAVSVGFGFLVALVAIGLMH